MNTRIARDDNNNKAISIAAIPMVAIIVTAGLLTGLTSLIGSNYYQQPAMAQQNMTGGGNATTTTDAAGGNQSEVRMHLEEARTALQNNDTQGALMHLDLAFNALGASGNATDGGAQGNTTTNTNTIAGSNAITTGSEAGGIPTVGGTGAVDVSDETEDDEASADRSDNVDESNGNTDANTRETDTGEEEQDSECGGVTVGGTSAADDYGCPPDPDA
jgi:hypothetical protein